MTGNKQGWWWSFGLKTNNTAQRTLIKILFSSQKQYLKEIWYNIEGDFLMSKKDTFLEKWLKSSIFYIKRETALWYLSLTAVSPFKGLEYTPTQRWK